MKPNLRSTHPTLRTPSVKTPSQKKSTRILVGSIAALLAFSTGAAQANTVTLSNGTNSSAIPTGVTDIFNIPGVGVTSGGTLILDNYQLFGNQGNGNANCGFGLGSNNNTFTLTNGSFFAFGGTTYPAGYGNTGFGSPFNWGAAGGSWQGGGGTTSNNVLNIQSGSTLAIGRRFCWANNLSNRVNVDGAGSKFINSNGANTNPVGGTWSVTNGGSVFMANVGYASGTTFNATIGGTDPNGYGSTWHSVGGFNGLNNAANIVTINSGGFLEFENLTPAFSIGSGAVNISGGGLSYGLPQNSTAYSGDLLGSNAGSAANTIGGFTWSGNNRFRINGGTAGITDNGTTAYTFANNLGSKNYYSLDLVGLTSITSRDVTFDGANGAEMLFKGATATVTGATKVQGGQVIVKADGAASTFTGVISDGASSGGLTITSSTVSSASTLTLLSANTYTGPTNINRGTLALGASGSINSSSTIAISGGATYNVSAVSGYALAGSQTLSAPSTGTATVSGAINAGASTITLQDATNIGILAFNNDLTLNGGTLSFDLGSSNTADRITLLGTPLLSGSNTINVAGLAGLTSLSVGDYTLMTATGGLGTTFTLANSTLTIGSHTYNLSLSSSTATAEILTLTAAGGGATSGQYTLATVVTGATLLHANGGTTTLSTTIQNTGTIPQDTLIFSALTATTGSGTVGAASGTTSGTGLALSASSSPAATQTYTAGATLGAVAISNSATVTNSTAVGSPVATNTGTAVTVYSGLSTWTGASGGSWGTLISGFGTNWDVNQGSPGVDTSFATTDTATFGNTAGSVTVNLNGANPSLNALTLNSTGSSTLAQGSGGGLTLAGASASITAAGTQAISAPLTLATTATVSVTGGADLLTISGAIGETGGAQALIKTGSGTLVLSGANQFTGAVLLASGTLVATNPTALGTSAGGTTVTSGATLDVQANLGTEAISLNGSGVGGLGALRTSTGTGTVGGVVTLASNSSVHVAAGSSLSLTGGISTPITGGDLSFVKSGLGDLNISGIVLSSAEPVPNRIISTRQGTTNFINATVHVSSLIQEQANNSYVTATNSNLDINDSINNWYNGGLRVGAGNANYSFAMTNGTLNSWEGFAYGLEIIQNGTGKGVASFYGTAQAEFGDIQIAENDNSFGVLNVRDAGVTITNDYMTRVGTSKGVGVINQLAGTFSHSDVFGESGVELDYRMGQNNCGGIFNLNGGTLTTKDIHSGDGTGGFSVNHAYFNFHGGTLKPTANSSNFIYSTLTGANSGTVSAPQLMVYSEGAVIDTDGKNITISDPLRPPSGQGVSNGTIVLTGANQGSGYRGEPIILIGDLSNISATAIANMVDDGTGNGTFKIASITITNPGVNFTSAPTFTINGGDPITSATVPALTIAANVSGGLTKSGAGTLTLAAANTYTGNTLVNTGTLALGHLNALQFSTLDTGISGAQAVTFTVAGTNTYNLGGLQGADALNAGSNSLSIGANNANTTSTGDLTAAAITKVGTGTLDLNGANQTSNSLTANAGTTNLNGALVTLTADVAVNNLGTKLRFGSVSQTLNSLTIGNGATVTFTSGAASGAFSGGDKFTGVSAVPEPGSLGLLLVGAIGVINRRRRP